MTKKVELVAPARDLDCLKVAVNSGADAVYVGLGGFANMRADYQNFTEHELREAIEYAHPRNVKILLAVNCLPRTPHLKEFLRVIDIGYELGVDAVMCGSLGLIHYATNKYPSLTVHASLTSGISNLESIRVMEALGVKRVNLPQCHSLEEIRNICTRTNLEIQIFVHDMIVRAQYEGRRCLLSSYLYGAHSNLGSCRAPIDSIGLHESGSGACWSVLDMPLRLIDLNIDDFQCFDAQSNEQTETSCAHSTILGCICDLMLKHKENSHFFSSNTFQSSRRQLCLLPLLPYIIEAGIIGLKIEGRSKPPEYIQPIITAYRQAIDSFYENPDSWMPKNEWIALAKNKKTFPFTVNDIPGNSNSCSGKKVGVKDLY